MYVRVAIAEVKPGTLEQISSELLRTFEQGVARGINIPGFLGHQFMIDHTSNKFAIISRWESLETELANRQGSVQQQENTLADYLAQPPIVEIYELKFET
jgi:heme-degrading monooxygenase HmoA